MLKDHFKVIKEDSSKKDVKIPLKLLEDDKNRFEYFLPVANLPAGGVSTGDLYFTADGNSSSTGLVLRAALPDGRYIQQEYALPDDSYKLDYQITFQGVNQLLAAQDKLQLTWINYLPLGRGSENKYALQLPERAGEISRLPDRT